MYGKENGRSGWRDNKLIPGKYKWDNLTTPLPSTMGSVVRHHPRSSGSHSHMDRSLWGSGDTEHDLEGSPRDLPGDLSLVLGTLCS